MGDSHVGLQARLMSQALRKLAGTLNRTDTICLFTNQLREKIGVMFGNPETTPGGRALKFYSSVRLDIRRIETLKEGVEAIGNRVRVKVVKNKVAPPFKQAEFDIIYGSGISWEGTVLDAGVERKIITKSGSYFSFDDERLGQGRQNATAFLREHPDVTHRSSPRSRRRSGRTRSSRRGCCRRPRADGRRRRREGRSRGARSAELEAARQAVESTERAGDARTARAAAATAAPRRASCARARRRDTTDGGAASARLERARRAEPERARDATSSGWPASGSSTTRVAAARARRALAERGYGDGAIRAASSGAASAPRPSTRPSAPSRPSSSARRGSSRPGARRRDGACARAGAASARRRSSRCSDCDGAP